MSQKIGRLWHHVDVAKDNRSLGRLASQIAITLMGKHKPIYDPSYDVGDYVVVTNCKDLKITGNKLKDKLYWRHSGKIGQLKLTPMDKVIHDKGYGEVLRKAVSGMLPKTKLRKARLERLKVFDGSEHPYKQNIFAVHDQQPEARKKLLELEQD
ncbi:50S ribosomal protein L13 [Wickerhamomyces ciferrii]|uniref:50S ribosomal protein L13 n=1 Tax=Wickerhamomyces ciferrii (strain ATCC 14091 / BCRC 22168 / CBS 111 / JCM 3599 / NBRC 0793 / NRRL Y-1031 F-60-10) TaxID=1206466 RepID=K0KQV0_WICCF|nr:50S ribosomal protein L13 [Wickerhamomyces ciferrii]CCH43699.1 50S ribosomal protein L13 [Wickerhamomyces ciferrii]